MPDPQSGQITPAGLVELMNNTVIERLFGSKSENVQTAPSPKLSSAPNTARSSVNASRGAFVDYLKSISNDATKFHRTLKLIRAAMGENGILNRRGPLSSSEIQDTIGMLDTFLQNLLPMTN